MDWYERQWADSVDFKDDLIELLDASKFGTKEYTPYEVYTKALYEYFQEELGENPAELGRSAVDLAEFQEDAVKKARRILARYDGVLIADSVGLGKTWIGKKLLEDFAYHRRQKAVVVCPASLREMWERELAVGHHRRPVVGMEELGRDTFRCLAFRRCRRDPDRRIPQLPQRQGQPLPGPGHDDSTERRPGPRRRTQEGHPPLGHADQQRPVRPGQPGPPCSRRAEADYFREAGIGDFNAYFRRARQQVEMEDTPAGVVLFNLLEEIMVRNTRPYIRGGLSQCHDQRQAGSLSRIGTAHGRVRPGATYGGLYDEIVAADRAAFPGTVQAGSL